MFERAAFAEVIPGLGAQDPFAALPGVSHAQRCAGLVERFGEWSRAGLSFSDAVAAWDVAGSWCVSGSTSPASWLRAHLGVSHATAVGMVSRSRRMRDHPVVGDEVTEGRLCPDQADMILAALVGREVHALRDLGVLVDQVAGLSFVQGVRAVQHWKSLVDAETAPDPEGDPQPVRSEFHVSPSLDGRFDVHGSLDTLGGATITAALDSAIEVQRAGDGGPGDDRTAGEQRADALLLIVAFFLDHLRTRPSSAGVRPHVSVCVDLGVLGLERPGVADVGRIRSGMSAAEARQVCCDANVTRVVTRGRSEVLDVGRSTRVWPSAMRAAVVCRDGCCRHPGCDAPAWFAEVHHVQHWARGGPTNLSNGVLLCRRHHYLQHHGWTCVGDANQALKFTGPTGDTYISHPPG